MKNDSKKDQHIAKCIFAIKIFIRAIPAGKPFNSEKNYAFREAIRQLRREGIEIKYNRKENMYYKIEPATIKRIK